MEFRANNLDKTCIEHAKQFFGTKKKNHVELKIKRNDACTMKIKLRNNRKIPRETF